MENVSKNFRELCKQGEIKMSIKLLKIQLEELKEAIILNDHASDDNFEERFEYLQQAMREIHYNLETLLKYKR